MATALELFGVLTLVGGVLAGLLLALDTGTLLIPAAYALGGIGSSLLFLGLANALRRLNDIQTIVGRPSH